MNFSSLERRGFEFGQQIGKGSTSMVFRTRYTDRFGNKTDLACKIINRKELKKRESEFEKKFLPREIELMKQLNHPNIIGTHGIYESHHLVFVFLRFAEKGTLLEAIQRSGKISDCQAKIWFQQILAGVSYIHGLGYSHRDIKCENIFISRHNNVKVGDFGYAKKCTKELSRTFCGSKFYVAPEIIKSIAYNPKKSDVFSCGVVLFVMMTGEFPFKEQNNAKLAKLQENRIYSRKLSVESNKNSWEYVAYLMLEPNPEIRLEIDEVVELGWVAKSLEKH